MSKSIMIAFLGDLHVSPRNTRFFNLSISLGHICDVSCYSVKGNHTKGIRTFKSIKGREETFTWRLFTLLLRSLRLVLPGHTIKNLINEQLHRFSAFEQQLIQHEYDLIYVSDLYLLPIALKFKKKAKVFFDAREYYPRQNDESIFFRLLDSRDRYRVCKKYMPLCDQISTVSDGIAEEYDREIGVKPHVIMSVPYYRETFVSNKDLDTIKIVYHGMANRNRRIENMIDIFRLLEMPAELHFYMVGDKQYMNEIKNYASRDNGVIFHEPIAPDKIVETINQFDIGFCFYEPTTFNVAHCLPNKFFEYIQARLAVAIGPSPEMCTILRHYECGIIADSFDSVSMANAINEYASRYSINTLKHNSDIAARELCFERELVKLEHITLHNSAN